MGSQNEERSGDIYLGPKIMAGIALLQLGSLCVANLMTDVSKEHNSLVLKTSAISLIGAMAGAVVATLIRSSRSQ